MKHPLATVAVALCAGTVLDAAAAQERRAAGDSATWTFAAPVRIQAGEAFLGEGRLYPSPVFHDIDGDGRLDLVVGDLRGLMTVALRLPGDGAPRFRAEEPLLGADGQPLKFHNW